MREYEELFLCLLLFLRVRPIYRADTRLLQPNPTVFIQHLKNTNFSSTSNTQCLASFKRSFTISGWSAQQMLVSRDVSPLRMRDVDNVNFQLDNSHIQKVFCCHFNFQLNIVNAKMWFDIGTNYKLLVSSKHKS